MTEAPTRGLAALVALAVVARVAWVGHAPAAVDSAFGAGAAVFVLGYARAGRLPRRGVAAAALALVAVCLGVLSSTSPLLSWIMQPAASAAIAWALAISALDDDGREGAAWGLAAAGALSGCVALYQRFISWPALLARADELGLPPPARARLEEGRALGLSLSPDLAAGLALGALFAALFLARRREGPARLAALGLALPALAQLFVSRSNGAFAALLVGLGVLGLAAGGRRLRLALAGGGVLVVGLAAALGRLGALASSAGERADNWRVALEIFAEHPLVGVGLFRFAPAYQASRAATDNLTRYAHSAPAQWLAELGVVGALLLVAALVVVVARRPRVDRERALLLAGGAAVLARGFIDYDLQVGQTAAFAAAAAALALPALFPREDRPAPPAAAWGIGAALLVVCAAPLWFTVPRAAALPVGERPDPEALQRYLARAPDDDGALVAALSLGLPGAEDAAKARLARPLPPPYLALHLAERALAAGRRDEARALLERAAAADPHHPRLKALRSALEAGDE